MLMCLFLFKCPLLSYYEADNNVPTSLLVVVPMAIYIFYILNTEDNTRQYPGAAVRNTVIVPGCRYFILVRAQVHTLYLIFSSTTTLLEL